MERWEECTVITERKASGLVDLVPMVNARQARPIETTEILQKCVSFWWLHSQSFIPSHCNQPITPNPFHGHYSSCCGGCLSCKQMLILLNIPSLPPPLSLFFSPPPSPPPSPPFCPPTSFEANKDIQNST